ncbi:MAG: glutaminyl-peptide cyclotransferase [Longimicrobiales bacterium]
MRMLSIAATLLALAAISACQDTTTGDARADSARFEIVRQYPHDPAAYTQGLVYENGGFLESTGVRGQSTLRRVVLETGEVLVRLEMPEDRFTEGLAVLGDRVYQLTWTAGIGYIYDRETLALVDSFEYSGEGWGLTTDGTSLVMSDGSANLKYIDPATFTVTKTVSVRSAGSPLSAINELEWVRGEIWANVYQSSWIVRIDPATGEVVRWLDAASLVPAEKRGNADEVLNGIAYDSAGDRLFLTGKRWPVLYEVRVVESTARS